MSEKTLKQELLEKINKCVYEFERATGCEVVTIKTDRYSRGKDIGDLSEKSIISNYELELK